MRILTKPFILASFLLLFAAVPARSAEGTGRLLMPGEWHGDEVSAEDGETWLALVHPSPDQWGLLRVNISVAPVHDELLDGPGKYTGRKVAIPAIGSQTIALISGLPGLEPGPVQAAEVPLPDLRPGRPVPILFSGRTYQLTVACGKEQGGREFGDCPLILSDSITRQVLQRYEVYRPLSDQASFAGDAAPSILWAGDLDRDGRLDLIVDLATHYNVSAPTLLLSSAARKGELVRPVAAFTTTGC